MKLKSIHSNNHELHVISLEPLSFLTLNISFSVVAGWPGVGACCFTILTSPVEVVCTTLYISPGTGIILEITAAWRGARPVNQTNVVNSDVSKERNTSHRLKYNLLNITKITYLQNRFISLFFMYALFYTSLKFNSLHKNPRYNQPITSWFTFIIFLNQYQTKKIVDKFYLVCPVSSNCNLVGNPFVAVVTRFSKYRIAKSLIPSHVNVEGPDMRPV